MTPRAPLWLPRLADDPRIQYAPPLVVDRRRLPGHGTQPRAGRLVLDDQEPFLEWPGQDGWERSSPADRWGCITEGREEDPTRIFTRLVEALELPGTPSDYHFLVQGGAESLWQHRRQHPWVLPVVEQFAWVSVRLAFTYRDTLRLNDTMPLPVLAFGRLVGLYAREGWVREAAHVMALAEQYTGQPWHDREALLARVRVLDEEAHG